MSGPYQAGISRFGDGIPMNSSAIAAIGPRKAYGHTMIRNDAEMRNDALAICRTPSRPVAGEKG